ncbi:MAG: C1 family peptidase [Ferruginibacter sp.]
MPTKTVKQNRIYNARPDTLDFRDKMYVASLYEVPTSIELEEYKKYEVPILDQGQEGACTGFGLATVANYLLRRRKFVPDPNSVSPRMIYEMARRYDEWPGEHYSGSSARGAMKGWHKHGICGDACWPYKNKSRKEQFNEARSSDALKRPLGAYYRVNHKDLVAMHSALAEVGILYATGAVHEGWDVVDETGIIPYMEKLTGGHAFAIVAYDSNGFWIQNSWSNTWGKEGFAQISYDDWLANGTDVWVARLGAPVTLMKIESTAIAHSAGAGKSNAYSYSDLRPHIISVGNDGQLNVGGNFGTTESSVKAIFEEDFPRITATWKKKRILLYAHGGLVSEVSAVQRLAEYRKAMIEQEVYPISFIWHSDYWTTLTNLLKDAFDRNRPEGFLDSAKDFLLNRLDDALEPLARKLTGKLQWDEMKENAILSTTSKTGGARLALAHIKDLANKYNNDFEIHVVGHSAGSIFHAPLLQLLTSKGKIKDGPLKGTTGYGLPVLTCTMWAPACTVELFKTCYLSAIKNKAIEKFALFILNDEAENDDNCAKIYNKSLLYLVSNAFEKRFRIPLFRPDGEAILGMQKFIEKDPELAALFKGKNAELVLSPNANPEGSTTHSTSTAHGAFDDDIPTVKATLARILNAKTVENDFTFSSSASSLKDRRGQLPV